MSRAYLVPVGTCVLLTYEPLRDSKSDCRVYKAAT